MLGIVGTGLLAQPTNIKLWVQAIGFGEADLVSPIDDASIELMLDTVPSEIPLADPITIVTACAFHSNDIIPAVPPPVKSEGKVICKLLNEDGNAIAEGSMPLSSYDPAETLIIRIDQPAFLGATNFGNVDDAMVIIEGPL